MKEKFDISEEMVNSLISMNNTKRMPTDAFEDIFKCILKDTNWCDIAELETPADTITSNNTPAWEIYNKYSLKLQDNNEFDHAEIISLKSLQESINIIIYSLNNLAVLYSKHNKKKESLRLFIRIINLIDYFNLPSYSVIFNCMKLTLDYEKECKLVGAENIYNRWIEYFEKDYEELEPSQIRFYAAIFRQINRDEFAKKLEQIGLGR